MRTRLSVLRSEEILNQAGKITVLHVTGAMRSELNISRITGKIRHQLHGRFLSKNVRLHKNPSIIGSCIPPEQSLPTT